MATPRPQVGRQGEQYLRQSQDCRRRFSLAILLRWWVLSLVVGPAWAAPEITTLQRLDFGVLGIAANSPAAAMQLTPQGSASYGSSLVVIGAGRPGRYRLSGYPIYTDMTVTVTPAPVSLLSGVPGETLSVTAVSTQPLVLHTDQNGQVEFDLGATLSTSGTGAPYQDGVYIGRPLLTLSFDVAGQPVQSYQSIDVDLVLRTSIALAEVQPLHFGQLAVYASATDQASLRLGPSGQLTLLNPGTARIVRFGGETPATIHASTGAAFAPVTIRLPSETVYLTHSSQAPEVARLLLSDFVSLPATGSATLNAQGALTFQLGATLRTELTTKRYQDGLYTGVYSLSVEY